MPRVLCVVAVLFVPVLALAQEPPPPDAPLQLEPVTPESALAWDKPTSCTTVRGTRYRHQCDAATRTCLVAVDGELGRDGKVLGELARVGSCSTERLPEGHRLVAAIAEAPPGWVRDARGRVMQFNFDMHRRVWIGGGFAPVRAQGGPWQSSGEAETGTRIDWDDDDGTVLRRLHLFEGRLDPGAGTAELTALTYDFSRAANAPVRITTFFGHPRRFDLPLDLGFYSRFAHVETFTRNGGETWVTLGQAEPTLDVWHSADLESYLRLRVGPGVDRDSASARYFVSGNAGLDLETILDRDGFHRLYADVDATRLWRIPERGSDAALHVDRLEARAGYELILLAVNDQPVSLVLEGRGGWRNDLAVAPAAWEWGGLAGLRFSFWAPARRGAKAAEAR